MKLKFPLSSKQNLTANSASKSKVQRTLKLSSLSLLIGGLALSLTACKTLENSQPQVTKTVQLNPTTATKLYQQHNKQLPQLKTTTTPKVALSPINHKNIPLTVPTGTNTTLDDKAPATLPSDGKVINSSNASTTKSQQASPNNQATQANATNKSQTSTDTSSNNVETTTATTNAATSTATTANIATTDTSKAATTATAPLDANAAQEQTAVDPVGDASSNTAPANREEELIAQSNEQTPVVDLDITSTTVLPAVKLSESQINSQATYVAQVRQLALQAHNLANAEKEKQAAASGEQSTIENKVEQTASQTPAQQSSDKVNSSSSQATTNQTTVTSEKATEQASQTPTDKAVASDTNNSNVSDNSASSDTSNSVSSSTSSDANSSIEADPGQANASASEQAYLQQAIKQLGGYSPELQALNKQYAGDPHVRMLLIKQKIKDNGVTLSNKTRFAAYNDSLPVVNTKISNLPVAKQADLIKYIFLNNAELISQDFSYFSRLNIVEFFSSILGKDIAAQYYPNLYYNRLLTNKEQEEVLKATLDPQKQRVIAQKVFQECHNFNAYQMITLGLQSPLLELAIKLNAQGREFCAAYGQYFAKDK
ncbi:hypothetical protein [Psittacicella hinzii]|uniref:Uncharacterized protein n=1 Tax=Psittacicella hinzii TaxID=2028575 RepID=A0A3A1YU87_9GAMM|nr:hypothetical protein [Psittacicella hinzii]RIY40440.1 hypothetical protein CKF58_00630 [Psittacicella hinzii]